MANTPEGIPIVTKDGQHEAANEIRTKGSEKLLSVIREENNLVADEFDRLANLYSADERGIAVLKKVMVFMYILLRSQGALDEVERNQTRNNREKT